MDNKITHDYDDLVKKLDHIINYGMNEKAIRAITALRAERDECKEWRDYFEQATLKSDAECHARQVEIDALKADLERHIAIAAELATENEKLHESIKLKNRTIQEYAETINHRDLNICDRERITERLKRLLIESSGYVKSQAGAEHMLDGFKPKRIPIDDLVDAINAATTPEEGDA